MGGGGGGGRGRWGEGAEGSLNENSSKREVFRLFIFRIVSPIFQQTSIILLIKLLHLSNFQFFNFIHNIYENIAKGDMVTISP